ncbi:PAS domain S-box protein [Chryseolinea sp. T2]|uniref:PAS domain-containing sensor histidine kinase n=1 Tax=Chryseolinea sp. T2 TaxID=3129255 RepID=UPI0030780716
MQPLVVIFLCSLALLALEKTRIDKTEPRASRGMSDMIEEFDWSATSLGSMDSWSEAFRSAVRLALNTKSPVLIVGGVEMIQIYNDAFAAMIGSRHPGALGVVGKQFWHEQWDSVGPIVKKVWATGEGILLENHRLVLVRKGYPKEMFFTTSYTPITSNSGIEGIYINITETTELLRKHENLQYLRNQLVGELFMHAPLALCILHGSRFLVAFANEQMLEMWDRQPSEVLNLPVFQAFPETSGLGYEALLTRVYATGEKAILPEEHVRINRRGREEEVIFKTVVEAVLESDGTITGVMILSEEITDEVLSRRRIEESEIRHKLAIEAASIGTFDWNLKSNDFQVSPRVAAIFGFADGNAATHEELIGRIHPADQAVRERAHREAVVSGSLMYEARVVFTDNTLHWVRLNGKLIFDDQRQPIRMYGTVLDITDQKSATERLEELVQQRSKVLQERNVELRNSEERYTRIVEEVQDYAIILLDRDGIVLNWNKSAEQLKHFDEKDVLGKHFRIFSPEEDRKNKIPDMLLEEALQTGRAVHEGWRIRKDGSRFWGSIVITALHDDRNNVTGFTKVTRDLSERRSAEEKMLAYTHELEAQNKELEQFAYVASHDLQEPLRKIRTFTELVQQNINDRKLAEKYFSKIQASAHRMSELIRSVLAYSKISKDISLVAPVNLNEVLFNVVSDFELMIEEKNAEVTYENLPTIMGISVQIGQLFSNLVSNGLKFSSELPVIKISSRRLSLEEVSRKPELPLAAYYEICVTDNGIGFEQQYAKKIFNMFQRLNRKEQYAGTGIGLALCKKIVEAHHGTISATSTPGLGTSFCITLPAAD